MYAFPTNALRMQDFLARQQRGRATGVILRA